MNTSAGPHPAAWFGEDRSEARRSRVRYGLSFAVVLAVLAALVGFGRSHAPGARDVAEVEDVTLVDLPPEQTGQGGAAEDAAPVPPVVAQQAPPLVARQPEPPSPPPPTLPNAAVPLPEKPAPPPIPVAAPAANADAAPGADTPPQHASARAVTAWQKALLKNLLRAEARVRRPAHARGTVRVAFWLNPSGRLLEARVAAPSGMPDLDALAVKLVRDGAPYPAPPQGTQAADLAFIVPVIFK